MEDLDRNKATGGKILTYILKKKTLAFQELVDCIKRR